MTFEQQIFFTDIIKKKIPELQLGIIEIQDFKISKKSENVDKEYHNLFSYIENKFAKNPPFSDHIVSTRWILGKLVFNIAE